MVKGEDGSLRPQPGALLKRLKQMEELSQETLLERDSLRRV